MVFFRKKEEKIKEEVDDIEEIKEAVEKENLVEEIKEEVIEEPKKPTFAPLFVKIERYRSVLNVINDLKTTTIVIKNALALQKSIESISDENKSLIESAIDKIDKKIFSLDSEFMRPKGFEDKFRPISYGTESLEGVVKDLKTQLEGLKSELKGIA